MIQSDNVLYVNCLKKWTVKLIEKWRKNEADVCTSEAVTNPHPHPRLRWNDPSGNGYDSILPPFSFPQQFPITEGSNIFGGLKKNLKKIWEI